MSDTQTTTVPADPNLIAYCGAYCGACAVLRSGRCAGCKRETTPAGCAVRACCREYEYASCADCARTAAGRRCATFDGHLRPPVGAGTDAGLAQLKRRGYVGYARYMAARRQRFLRRR